MPRDLSKEQKKCVKLFKEFTETYDNLVKQHKVYLMQLEAMPPGPEYDALNEERKINEAKAYETNDKMVSLLKEINKMETEKKLKKQQKLSTVAEGDDEAATGGRTRRKRKTKHRKRKSRYTTR